MDNLKRRIKSFANELGFDLVGVAAARSYTADQAIALERLGKGLMSGLPWYTDVRVRRGCNPQQLLPEVRSVISVGMSYNVPDSNERRASLDGKIARYSWGEDYHNLMKSRLSLFVDKLRNGIGRSIAAKWYVDDGPMLDRAVAQRAGVGWFGKNTNILTQTHGSWVFLGQVITDLEIEPDRPLKKTCGSCVKCIEACPTGAIVAPYVIDNTRCISYLTIENRGSIPIDLRPLMHDWVFGCDICQEVCPVNIKGAYSTEQAFNKRRFVTLDLISLLEMDEDQFQERFRDSPIKRAKLWGIQRNACVALGNSGDHIAVIPLINALKSDLPVVVRSHAAWALGSIGGRDAVEALKIALAREEDPQLVDEILSALKQSQS